MLTSAAELCGYVETNDEFVCDLVYASYRIAEANDWLSFWGVPSGIPRREVLSYVDGFQLQVSRTSSQQYPLESCISARIRWDREHGLHFVYWQGQLVTANDDSDLLLALVAKIGS